MLRLLGILSLGNLLFGGRRHRHALGRGLLLGGILGYLASRNFDPDRAAEDFRESARNARETARKAVKAARKEIREARKVVRDQRIMERREIIHEEIEARKAARDLRLEERMNAVRAAAEDRKARREQPGNAGAEKVAAMPATAGDEAQANRELVEELERDARTAAMAASVPTIHFPEEENEKYYSSGKYGYA